MTRPPSIDINADLGEGFPNDDRLLDVVTSASVSCGAHAGDRGTIVATLRTARDRGVAVGAHPGYADREGFGRRELDVSTDEVARLILEQFAALDAVAKDADIPLLFVKPHGALYNQAQRHDQVARGVVEAVRRLGLPVLGQAGGALERLSHEAGVRLVAEGFPDRRYEPDGRLVPRTHPGAVLLDPREIEAQVVRFVVDGVATLCIHGDDPRAVDNAENVRSVLSRHGIVPRFWGAS